VITHRVREADDPEMPLSTTLRELLVGRPGVDHQRLRATKSGPEHEMNCKNTKRLEAVRIRAHQWDLVFHLIDGLSELILEWPGLLHFQRENDTS
jgi:hypothetical protein